MPAKPVLSIGLDKKGKVIEVRDAAGKKIKLTKNPSKHNCGEQRMTRQYTLGWHSPSPAALARASSPSTARAQRSKKAGETSRKASNPCCIDDNGTLLCFPPCV
jgi:hypothetical protein